MAQRDEDEGGRRGGGQRIRIYEKDGQKRPQW